MKPDPLRRQDTDLYLWYLYKSTTTVRMKRTDTTPHRT